MSSSWDILQPNDFPLISIGANVYRQQQSIPLFTVLNEHIAADLAYRLNCFEASKVGISYHYPSQVVFGPIKSSG